MQQDNTLYFVIHQVPKNLPNKLADQLTMEYENRLREVRYLTSGKFDFYTDLQVLKSDILSTCCTISLLLVTRDLRSIAYTY
jgi:hypothetical protein